MLLATYDDVEIHRDTHDTAFSEDEKADEGQLPKVYTIN